MSTFKDDKGSGKSGPRKPFAPRSFDGKPGGGKLAGGKLAGGKTGVAPGRGERPMFAKRPLAKSSPARPAPQATATTPRAPDEDARIAKVMARAGLCSRRDAEAWIAQGRVVVNGAVLTSPAFNVTARDKIEVDGKALSPRERTRLFLFHKPRGLVTTEHDPEGRPTIFNALPPELPRLMAVGRLDINTEGLLLLSNDGGLARMLELPKTGWTRRYRVRANGETNQPALDRLRDGVSIDGVDYQGIEARLDRQQGANAWLTMTLREGKNREIKRVLEHIGLYVNRLIRLSYGPFQLADLGEGALEEVPTRVLQDQLGAALAAEAGADFEAPVAAPLMSPHEREAWLEERAATRRRDEQAKLAAHTRHGAGRQGVAATQVERIAPGPRKHVSALRGARGAPPDHAPRQRVARAVTADRKGRAVAVERIAAVPARGKGPAEGRTRSRNADRFEEEKRREMRVDAATFGERRVRKPVEEERPRKAFGERKFGERTGGEGKFGERKYANGEGRDGKPGERKFAGRNGGAAKFGAGRSDERTFPDRKPGGRAFGAGKAGEKHVRAGPRKDGDAAAPGAGRPSRSGGKTFGARPGGAGGPSRPGGRPSGGKPFGARPGGGGPRPGSRPRG